MPSREGRTDLALEPAALDTLRVGQLMLVREVRVWERGSGGRTEMRVGGGSCSLPLLLSSSFIVGRKA